MYKFLFKKYKFFIILNRRLKEELEEKAAN
jgi:hypothetical protein